MPQTTAVLKTPRLAITVLCACRLHVALIGEIVDELPPVLRTRVELRGRKQSNAATGCSTIHDRYYKFALLYVEEMTERESGQMLRRAPLPYILTQTNSRKRPQSMPCSADIKHVCLILDEHGTCLDAS